MFDVLAFVYENYQDSAACPGLLALHRTLGSIGFAPRQVEAALLWLEDLKSAARYLPHPGTPKAVGTAAWQPSSASAAQRVLTAAEQQLLGPAGWGLLAFLVSAGTLSPDMRELVLERAMAAPGDPLAPSDLKLIVLMVFWSLGCEPDALVLDELCDIEPVPQLAH